MNMKKLADKPDSLDEELSAPLLRFKHIHDDEPARAKNRSLMLSVLRMRMGSLNRVPDLMKRAFTVVKR